jgi:hypothetical protein
VSPNGTLQLLAVSNINQGYITSINSAWHEYMPTTDEVSVGKRHGRRVTYAAVSLPCYCKYKKCKF